MKILFRSPMNKPLELMEIENDLKPIQKLIGGYIQVINITEDIICILDEEGIIKELDNNFYDDNYGAIVGNCIFCSMDEDEFASLTDKQIEYVAEYIGFPVIDEGVKKDA